MGGEGAILVREEAVDLARLDEIGRRLAASLRGGDVVLLKGPLGVGKTALVRVVAEALGVVDTPRSPSFTIANVYRGALRVHHLDLYRLEAIGDEDVLSLEEYVQDDAVTLVEWPEAAGSLLGRPAFIVRMEHDRRDTRTVTIEAVRDVSADRWRCAEFPG